MTSTRGAGALLLATCAGLGLVLSGCLAQEADLRQVQRDLDKKYTVLNQREQEIQKAIDQANKQIAQQKKEVDQLVSETRARLRNEISELREQDLPKINGALDEQNHRLAGLSGRLDDVNHRAAIQEQAAKDAQAEADKLVKRLDALSATILAAVKGLEGRLDEHQKALAAGDQRSATLTQQLEVQSRSLSDKMGQFSKALGDFKQALAGLSEKLVQDEHRLAEVSSGVTRRTDAMSAKLEADAKATSAHLAEVNKSVASVAKALENASGALAARLDEQERRMEHLAEVVQESRAQIQSLSESVTALRDAREPSRSSKSAKPKKPATHHVEPERESALPIRQAQERSAGTARDEDSGPVGLASAARASLPASVTDSTGNAAAEDADESYARALRLLKGSDYDGARREFTAFLLRYPESKLAPNAQYWLGECYYAAKAYRQAIEAFNRVEETYPASDKVPAALLKSGYASLALHDDAGASTTLKHVIAVYPKSPEAGKAKEKLTQLRTTH